VTPSTLRRGEAGFDAYSKAARDLALIGAAFGTPPLFWPASVDAVPAARMRAAARGA